LRSKKSAKRCKNMIFNPDWYENSRPDGVAVIEVINTETNKTWFIPLRKTVCEGTINGPLGDFSITHTFRFDKSTCPHTIEAFYRFPLPGDAAVHGFSVRFGEVEINSDLKPRVVAEEEYDRAKKEGKSAALLTRESPDVFTLSITGMHPDEDVVVTTKYYQAGRSEGTGFAFRIPLTTSPRYVRSDEVSSYKDAQPLALVRDPGHRFSLSITTFNGIIRSPTNALITDDKGVSRLSSGDIIPDCDCVLTWVPPDTIKQPSMQVFLDGHDDPCFLALVSTPAVSVKTYPRDVIIMVDHSGSMEGVKWEAATWAVEHFLRGLNETDYINICLFETHAYWFSPQPLPVTKERIKEAIEFIRDKRSGGTELGVALEQAFSQDRVAGKVSRQVLIITDAEVTDSGRILRLIEDEVCHTDPRRCSILCIDAAPNSTLALQMAERGGGVAKFLTSSPEEEDITSALDEILRLLDAPAAIGLSIAVNRGTLLVDGRRVTKLNDYQCDIDIGDLPCGITAWVAAKAPIGDEPLTFTLHGCGTGLEIPVTTWPAVRALFGARLITELESISQAGYAWYELTKRLSALGFFNISIPDDEKKVYHENKVTGTLDITRKIIIEESLKYGILSSETAFIAVRNEKGETVKETVIVPNALPKGWSDSFLSSGRKCSTRILLPKTRKIPSMPGGGSMLDLSARNINYSSMIMQPDGTMKLPNRNPGRSTLSDIPVGYSFRANQTGWCMFSGRPVFEQGVAVLYNSALQQYPKTIPDIPVLHRLCITIDRTLVRANSRLEIQLFVDDPAVPKVKVSVRDLVKSGGCRPLNIRWVKGSIIVLKMFDPNGELGQCPANIKIELSG
jgi:Ca-activated chloride channel homolog